jgi:hypothetical protein
MDLTYKRSKFFAMLTKKKSKGKNHPLPIKYANGQSRSATASVAVANAANATPKFNTFYLTLVKDFAVQPIEHFTAKVSEGDEAAFAEAVEEAIDSAFESIAESVGYGLVQDSSGVLGIIDSAAGAPTYTLTKKDDIVRFEIGKVVGAYNASTFAQIGSDFRTITAVDRRLGTFTLDASFTTGGATHAVIPQGDVSLKISGLKSWLPYTDPGGSDDFYGVNRSVDRVRLAGSVIDGTGLSVADALQDGATELSINGGVPGLALMHPRQFNALRKELGSKSEMSDVLIESGEAKFSFKALKMHLDDGNEMVCIGDRNVDNGLAYLLDLDTWAIYCPEAEAINLYDDDGNSILRAASSFDLEVRTYFYGQLGCNSPGRNCVIQLTEVT